MLIAFGFVVAHPWFFLKRCSLDWWLVVVLRFWTSVVLRSRQRGRQTGKLLSGESCNFSYFWRATYPWLRSSLRHLRQVPNFPTLIVHIFKQQWLSNQIECKLLSLTRIFSSQSPMDLPPILLCFMAVVSGSKWLLSVCLKLIDKQMRSQAPCQERIIDCRCVFVQWGEGAHEEAEGRQGCSESCRRQEAWCKGPEKCPIIPEGSSQKLQEIKVSRVKCYSQH